MRVWFSGPRVLGMRTGVSFGPEDFRRAGWRSAGSRPASSGGYVYVIQREGDDRIKVGCSIDPPSRLASLQTASADPLTLAYTLHVAGDYMAVEQEAHSLLAKHRGLGEWFAVPVDVAVAAISAAAFRLRPTGQATALSADTGWTRFAKWTAFSVPFWLALGSGIPALALLYLMGVAVWGAFNSLTRPVRIGFDGIATALLALVAGPIVSATLLALAGH